MSDKSIVQITLKAGESVTKHGKPKLTQGFYMMGAERVINKAPKGTKPDYQLTGMNSIERLILMSKREQLIIRLMINNIKWVKDINSLQHVVELKPDSVDFNPAVIDYMPYSSFLKGFALLHAGDIMRRVAKHKYMLNPNFFIPTGPLAPHFRLIWQEAKQQPSIITPIVEPDSFAFDDYESSDTDIF